jgi:pSer/pThr/pTyr-binding forkhead associated (FHA) protein
MSDQLLNTLKVALLGLLYLFFARVLWAVWTEVRVPTAPGLTASRLKKQSAPRSGKKAALATPAKLLMVEPPSMRGSTLSLDDEVLVGRSGECNVTLADDPFVSTKHARFFRSGDNWFVEDLGSTNGTLVNAIRIGAAQMLRVDDRVQTGSAVFEVH